MAKRKGMDRRQFVTTTGAAAAALALGPTILIKRPQKTLKIMQWSHFVPAYDTWFDKYAKDWGTQKGVEVTVDHIALADLTTRANAEVAAQQGHDLFQFLSPPGAFEPQVLEMADVVHPELHLRLSHRAGQQAPGRRRHLLRPGAERAARHGMGVRARDGDLRDLEVRAESRCGETVPARPRGAQSRRDLGQQALQLPVLPRGAGRFRYPTGSEAYGGHGLAAAADRHRSLRL